MQSRDLRKRERTCAQNIGFVRRDGEARFRDQQSRDAILSWAADRDMDGAVWTDLPSNFAEKLDQPFSVDAALTYVQTLEPEGKAKALEYVRWAPSFVRTPLRDALANLR